MVMAEEMMLQSVNYKPISFFFNLSYKFLDRDLFFG